jgi:hypothetical protein
MNYIDAENSSLLELKMAKITIEKMINEYPEGSEFRQKLEEDLWDVNDVISRYEESA